MFKIPLFSSSSIKEPQISSSSLSWLSSIKIDNSNFNLKKSSINETQIINSSNSSFPINHGSFGVVDEVFSPYRTVLWIFGRFPFSPGPKLSNLSIHQPYSHSIFTRHWIYFITTSIFINAVFILCSLGFMNVFLKINFLNLNSSTKAGLQDEERIIKENLVAFVLFWSCLFHASVSSTSFWKNRTRFVNYLNDWNLAMDVMGMNVPCEIKKKLIFSNVLYFGFLVVILISYTFGLHKIARGASIMVTKLTLQKFVPYHHHDHDYDSSFDGIYLFGLFTIIYGIYASRSVIFIYLFKTHLLRHGFKIWNERLQNHLYNNNENNMSVDDYKEKIICEKLYNDHIRLVKLIKQTDDVFGSILQSYYLSQILNMCFELYFLAKFGQMELNKSEQADIVAAIVLLTQTVLLVFTISLQAAYVHEEALKGFEILRSRGLHVQDSICNKYLIYNLHISYSNRIVLTGGKFFSIDRPFIITVLGAVFTYFIIILQFGIGNKR